MYFTMEQLVTLINAVLEEMVGACAIDQDYMEWSIDSVKTALDTVMSQSQEDEGY